MKKLVIFSAEAWCSSCKSLKESLNKTTLNLPIEIVDVDQDHNAVQEYSIRSVPTLLLMQDNQVIKRKTGTMKPDELLKFIE